MKNWKYLYAPMIGGRVLFDEAVKWSDMAHSRCREKIRSPTGSITNKWGPEKSWRRHWTDKGATIVKLRITEIIPL